MLTRDDRLVAAGHSVDPVRWAGILDELMTRAGARFRRVEPRRRARALVVGLPAGLPRKNCWTVAEHAGDAAPDGMQHLLARVKWDADGVRDDVRGLRPKDARFSSRCILSGVLFPAASASVQLFLLASGASRPRT